MCLFLQVAILRTLKMRDRQEPVAQRGMDSLSSLHSGVSYTADGRQQSRGPWTRQVRGTSGCLRPLCSRHPWQMVRYPGPREDWRVGYSAGRFPAMTPGSVPSVHQSGLSATASIGPG